MSVIQADLVSINFDSKTLANHKRGASFKKKKMVEHLLISQTYLEERSWKTRLFKT